MSDTFKFLQAQNFSLSGSGCVIGATSITLKSFTTIDGSLITMSMLGSLAFMTLEPGNGALEEQISFTGATQNSNGTCTLTGVSNVTFESPYTATSGVLKTHAGSTTAVLSNTSGFYDRLSAKGDDETITGTWAFTNPNYPRMDTATPYPTDNEQLATKGYADSLTFAGAPDATTTQKGIVELATQAEVDAGTAIGGTGASIVATPATTRSLKLFDYLADTGAADAYAITPSPAISAYAIGQRFTFKVAHTNTTTSTVVVNALGATAIFKQGGSTNLVAGDLVAGQIVEVEYNGVNGFMLMTPTSNTVSLTAGAYPAGSGVNITGTFPKRSIQTNTVTIASSTAETTLYTFSIAGGTLGTNNGILFTMFTDTWAISNTKTCTLRLKYGSTTVASCVALATGSYNGPGVLTGQLLASGATNSQFGAFQMVAGGNNTANVIDPALATATVSAVGTAAEDSTGALAFTLTAQFNNSSAGDSIVTRSFVAQLIS